VANLVSASREATGGSKTAIGSVFMPTLACAGAIVVLISLGMWQLERLEWKEALIADLTSRLAVPPIPLPPPRDWANLGPADEFRRFTLTATFEHDKEGLVFTSGSALRADGGGPGYWVFTSARLENGPAIMINRGFVPQERKEPTTRESGQITGPIMLTGALRFAEERALFTPAPNPRHNIWFSRDSASIAAAKGIDAAPFYIELEGPEPPGGLPHGARLSPTLPNNHFQYALTWFGLAAVFSGGYAFWLFGSWRAKA
jgi:surfeit locus 1 family protein